MIRKGKQPPTGRDAGNGVIALPFQKRATGAEVPFHNSIMGNVVVYQHRLEAHFLQLFAHLKNSEWFSIICVSVFEVNFVAEQKQALLLVTILLFYISFYCPQPFCWPPCPTCR